MLMKRVFKSLVVALSSPTALSLIFTEPIHRSTCNSNLFQSMATSPAATAHQSRSYRLTAVAKDSPPFTGQKKKRKSSPSPGSPPKTKYPTATKAMRPPPINKIIKTSPQNRQGGLGLKETVLPEPSVVFSNNHILLVNKPAGYHSQPNASIEQTPSKKCLLSKLKASELGGGSANNFLLPMHRLDQPCTGIILLAKNSKAGTRTGNAFRKHVVQKDYFCVVEGNIDEMMQRSERVQKEIGPNMYKLTGVLMPGKLAGGNRKTNGGKSVIFKPMNDIKDVGDKRVCHLKWEHLLTVKGSRKGGSHLVRVVTGTGAKHQVRAMLSQLAKSPVCGDLRYGASGPLPDQSVALHARSLFLPTVDLGDTDMKAMRFVAPIPKTWTKFFSLKEAKIPKINYEGKQSNNSTAVTERTDTASYPTTD